MLLFGSRLDDRRRGGDIDLPIGLPEPLSADDTVERRTRFTARLYRLLEERRIDVVMTQQGRPDGRAVVATARKQGVELAAHMRPGDRLSVARWEADRHAAVAPSAVERIVAACEAEFLRTT